MTANTATAKRTATVYYVVVNGEQVAEAKRPELGRDKFAEITAADTTSHVVLRTAKGKVLEERPAAEVEADAETINIPGLGDVSAAGLEALKNVGAELKEVREAQEARAAKANADEPTEDALALLGDALDSDEDDADAQADAEGRMDTPLGAEFANPVVVAEEVKAEAKPAKKTAAPVVTTPQGDVAITTYADMIGVFTAAVAKGEMGSGSLAGYKAGVRAVLKAQADGMNTDLTKVDVEMAVAVFEAKTPGILTQTSKTYIADFKRAVTLYNLYLADPKGFRFPAKNIRASRLVAPAAPVATPAPAQPAKKTTAPKAPKGSKKTNKK